VTLALLLLVSKANILISVAVPVIQNVVLPKYPLLVVAELARTKFGIQLQTDTLVVLESIGYPIAIDQASTQRRKLVLK